MINDKEQIGLTELFRLILDNQQKKELEIGIAYEVFMRYQRTVSSNGTIEYYERSTLKFVFDFLETKGITKISEVTNDTIYDFIDFERKHNIKDATINKRLGAFVTMTNYLINEGLISSVKFKFTKLKVAVPETKIPSDDDMIKFINYIEHEEKSPILKAMFWLIMDTGVRRTELTRIKTKNVDLNKNRIFLSETKTKNPRYIYFSNETKKLILSIYNKDNLYLFKTRDNETISINYISGSFTKIRNLLKLENFSCHKIRHYYATTLIKNKVRINDVQTLLGHTSLQMTLRYLHSSDDELKDESLKNSIRMILALKNKYR